MEGETGENVLTKGQMRGLAKKRGKVAHGEFMRFGEEEVMKNYNGKNTC